MPLEQLKENYYENNYKQKKQNCKQKRKSIVLFGHKYYFRPKALKIYKIIGNIISTFLIMASMCIWYCIFWVMIN